MILFSANDALDLDEKIRAHNLSDLDPLMEEAGSHVAHFVKEIVKPSQKIIILAGPGNNGGDAFVAARILIKKGYSVDLFATPSGSRLCQVKRALISQPVRPLGEILNFNLNGCVLVDGLFGVGLARDLDTEFQKVIEHINQNAKKMEVIAIDVPSGLDATLGIARPVAVKANSTLALVAPKAGCFINEGPAACGRIRLKSLKIDPKILKTVSKGRYLVSLKQARKILPGRSSRGHKAQGGKAFILGGDPPFFGAALLSAQAATRIGAGYTFIYSNFEGLEKFKNPDFIYRPTKRLSAEISQASSVLVGPGLKAEEKTRKLIEFVINQQNTKVVLDAGALEALAKMKDLSLPRSWILTPHEGEMARLIEKDAAWISNHKEDALKLAHQKYGGVFVLKGFRTVVYNGQKFYYILSGNRALAKAGTGDVLAGMITGLLSQGMPFTQAAVLGAFCHGFIADQWVRGGRDHLSLRPLDLIEALPTVLHQIRKKTKG